MEIVLLSCVFVSRFDGDLHLILKASCFSQELSRQISSVCVCMFACCNPNLELQTRK